ncbi:unnamed protein product [marine sediment metagenome]|uniref:Uncharacterized protein n=1 Tax=marine sediment metagenome TaxID=412755 RepID=X1UCH6_9ZZZZ
MSEEEKKPTKILVELTIPTKESVLDGIRKMFPTVDVKVIGEKEEETPPPS